MGHLQAIVDNTNKNSRSNDENQSFSGNYFRDNTGNAFKWDSRSGKLGLQNSSDGTKMTTLIRELVWTQLQIALSTSVGIATRNQYAKRMEGQKEEGRVAQGRSGD